MSQGSVLFYNASDQITQDNANFFWDDTNNRFGLGTSSPVHRLHVIGPYDSGGNVGITFESQDAGSVGPVLDLYHNSASPAAADLLSVIRFMGKDSGANKEEYASIAADLNDPTNASEDSTIRFRTIKGGTLDNRLVIKEDKVGIGTASPVHRLHVVAPYDSGSDLGITFESQDAGAVGPVLDLYHNSASPAAADLLGVIRFFGKDSGTNKQEYASIAVDLDDPTSGSEGSTIRFRTSSAGTADNTMSIKKTYVEIARDYAGTAISQGGYPFGVLNALTSTKEHAVFGHQTQHGGTSASHVGVFGEAGTFGTGTPTVETGGGAFGTFGRLARISGPSSGGGYFDADPHGLFSDPSTTTDRNNQATALWAESWSTHSGTSAIKAALRTNDASGRAVWAEMRSSTHNAPGDILRCGITDGTTEKVVLRAKGDRNIELFGGAGVGGGVNVVSVKNADTAPSSNPSGGGLLYAQSGAGKWRGSSGTVTTFGPADPHCSECGYDFVRVYENALWGAKLVECEWCGHSKKLGPKTVHSFLEKLQITYF